ncbi:uncharacterized protein PV07_07903 [Cladophialophora immunda]|uniref:Nephrocystin 3-like N-terminal domain-containing protein n=1 Tax=Cladophialophora immunda TaxID=569365 RepID=A0A0D2CAX9_9EURO|nr:uncharacterized protein PV07_07903 [Cladophialophora immunda]KIW28223.1 hypothetical protein PV07_07903 [Cladophialophora immunda]
MSRDPFQAALLDDFQIGHSMSRSLLKRISNVFGLGDNDRCLDAVEKCLEVLNLNHQVEEITSLQLVASEDARETQHSLETDLRNRYQDTCTRCLRSFSFSAMGFYPSSSMLVARFTKSLQLDCTFALMHSLLCQSLILKCEFLPKFVEKESRSDSREVTWQAREIGSLFHSIIIRKQPQGIEILIDALDECKEEEIRAMVRRFERSIDIATQPNVPLSICWSSHHYPTISMLSMHGVEVCTDKYNSTDIKQFVRSELPVRLDPLLLSIQDEIISRANGVFLSTVLVSKRILKAFDQGKTKQQLQELLDSIPVELDDLSGEISRKAGTSTQGHKELVRLCAVDIVCLSAPNLTTTSQRVQLAEWEGVSRCGRFKPDGYGS